MTDDLIGQFKWRISHYRPLDRIYDWTMPREQQVLRAACHNRSNLGPWTRLRVRRPLGRPRLRPGRTPAALSHVEAPLWLLAGFHKDRRAETNLGRGKKPRLPRNGGWRMRTRRVVTSILTRGHQTRIEVDVNLLPPIIGRRRKHVIGLSLINGAHGTE